MLNQLKKNKNEGFTIIEVMIVLAIAGLIILVVLLAVPALQRSSRNTTIKNDATSLAGGISEFASNNNGATPTKGTIASGVLTLANATIATGATVKLQGATTVNGASSGAVAFKSMTPPTTATAAAGALYVDYGETCQSVSGTAPTKSSRALAIYYWTETPGVKATADAVTGINNGLGLKGQCLDS